MCGRGHLAEIGRGSGGMLSVRGGCGWMGCGRLSAIDLCVARYVGVRACLWLSGWQAVCWGVCWSLNLSHSSICQPYYTYPSIRPSIHTCIHGYLHSYILCVCVYVGAQSPNGLKISAVVCIYAKLSAIAASRSPDFAALAATLASTRVAVPGRQRARAAEVAQVLAAGCGAMAANECGASVEQLDTAPCTATHAQGHCEKSF